MEQVKKRSKKIELYLTIVDEIKNNNSPIDICSKYSISKQKLQYYLNDLKKEGIIKKIGYGTWEVQKEVQKSSLGLRADKPLTNLHALQIKFPILQGKVKDNDWEIKNKLNNWFPKYKKLDQLGGLTIRNNNNKSITVHAKTRNISSLDEVSNLAFKIRAYINDFFKKQGVILDVFNAETKNLNLATEDKNSESMIRKGEKFELNLNKKSEKIFPQDKIAAKAWIDGSPFKFSAETNDLEWKREYLSMPFRIANMIYVMESMTGNLAYIAENYKSHVKLVEEGSKVFKRLNNLLSQKKLGDWL